MTYYRKKKFTTKRNKNTTIIFQNFIKFGKINEICKKVVVTWELLPKQYTGANYFYTLTSLYEMQTGYVFIFQK